MLDATTSYSLITRDLDAALERTAQDPTVERATDKYLEKIGKITSVDEFLADSDTYGYAMKAFGLEDMTYAKAFMRKVLTEGVSDKASFANQLTDTRYKEFASAFNFAALGPAATQTDAAKGGVVNQYVRQTLETNAGEDNEGARLALYFDRQASSITSFYNILADDALLKVMQVTFGIPAETGNMDIDKQADLYAKFVDLADFQDPAKVQDLMTRFTAMYDATETTARVSNPSLSLFSSSSNNIDGDLLLTLQSFRTNF